MTLSVIFYQSLSSLNEKVRKSWYVYKSAVKANKQVSSATGGTLKRVSWESCCCWDRLFHL